MTVRDKLRERRFRANRKLERAAADELDAKDAEIAELTVALQERDKELRKFDKAYALAIRAADEAERLQPIVTAARFARSHPNTYEGAKVLAVALDNYDRLSAEMEAKEIA